jgi:hypothetical protein
MTTENETLRESLSALMKSAQLGLPQYAADPIVQRRVGKMLVAAAEHAHSARDEN